MKNTAKINLALLSLFLGVNGLYAQHGFGTNQPSKAAVMDLQSQTKGLLIPRVALTSLTNFLPIRGESATNIDKTNSLLVYNTATVGTDIRPGYFFWTTNGTTGFWKRLLANDEASALTLAGDVTGTLGDSKVEKIQNVSVASTLPANNQVLMYNGTSWTPTAVTPATISGKEDLSLTDGLRIASGSGSNALLNAAGIGISDRGINPVKITPGTNGQVLTTNAAGNSAWADKSSLITAVSNTSTNNLLSTTVNGTTGTAVNIINTNTLALNASNELTSTVNGVTSAGLNIAPAVTAATTHTLGMLGNTLTSTVNGVAPTVSILNNFSNTLSGTTLSTNANGLTASVDLASAIKAGETQTALSQNATTGVITYTPESGSANATTANVLSTATGNIITYNAGAFLDVTAVQSNQKNTIVQGTGAISVPAGTTTGNNTTYTVGVNTATTSSLGVVMPGSGLSIANGILSVNTTSTGIGKTLTGSGITVNGGTSLANTVLTDVTLGIADNSINSAKIENGSVQGEDLNANVAGNGLTQSAGGALQVNAQNGINVTNDLVKLGGTLTENTTLTHSTFDLTLATTTTGSTGKLKVSGLDKTKVQATINTGTTTGITEHVLALGSDNIVKALKATMPKFFYMPSIIVPIANSQFTAINATAGESFTDATRTGVLNLYERYKAQFGTTGTATQPSSPGAPVLPVLPASELHYYVTWFDTAVFQTVSVDATGKMTYVVRTGVDVSVGSFMNIVFAVKQG